MCQSNSSPNIPSRTRTITQSITMLTLACLLSVVNLSAISFPAKWCTCTQPPTWCQKNMIDKTTVAWIHTVGASGREQGLTWVPLPLCSSTHNKLWFFSGLCYSSICGIKPDGLTFTPHMHEWVLGAHDPVQVQQSCFLGQPLVSTKQHCILGTAHISCHFGPALTQLSSHQNLALVKVTQTLMLCLIFAASIKSVSKVTVHFPPWQVPL